MSERIRQYYIRHKTPEVILNKRMQMFENNPDIAAEFEQWINDGKYVSENAVEIEGYTAKLLSEASMFLDGEGAFVMLVELRANPKNALEQIKSGLKIK